MKLPRVKYWELLVLPSLAIGVGFMLNAICIAFNLGKMPVEGPVGCPADPNDVVHGCMTAATHLKVLADWILLNHTGVFSLGDMLMWGGDIVKLPAFYMWTALMIKEHNE